MAISVAWQTTVTMSTSGVYYTLPTSGNFSTYARDLVITNGGSVTCFIGFASGATGGATTSSFQVPAGGTVILTQCQVPAGIVSGTVASGLSVPVSIGFATNVAYI